MPYETQDKAVWQTFRERESSSSRLTLALKLYSIMGLVLAIVGSGYLVYEIIRVSLQKSELLALTVSIAGLLMAVLSWAILVLRRELLQRRAERVHEYLLVGRFIQAWATFEETARLLVQRQEGDEHLSVRAILERLKREKVLKPTDLIRIDEILQLRNAMVHSGVVVPTKEIENAYQMLLFYAEELAKVKLAASAA